MAFSAFLKEAADFFVGGLVEVVVVLAYCAQMERREDGDEGVGFAGEVAGYRSVDYGDGEDDGGGALPAEGGEGGADAGAGGDAVVDEENGFAADVGGRALAAVGGFAADELGALAGEDGVERCGRHAEGANAVVVDELDAAGGDGADGQLWNVLCADFAHDKYVEWDAESAGNLITDNYAAAGNGENEDVVTMRVGKELGGETLPGFGSVAEAHAIAPQVL